jgi:hypothetical protein
MFLLNSFRFGGGGGGAFQRNQYSDFADPAAYVLDTGMSVTGGKLVYASVAAFKQLFQNYGYRTPVTPSIPYTMAVLAESVTGGPINIRLYAEYWRGQQFSDGQSAIRIRDDSTDIAINNRATLSATFDNFTCTG